MDYFVEKRACLTVHFLTRLGINKVPIWNVYRICCFFGKLCKSEVVSSIKRKKEPEGSLSVKPRLGLLVFGAVLEASHD